MGQLARALDRGAATAKACSPDGYRHKWHIQYAGNCMSPVLVDVTGRPLTKTPKSAQAFGMGLNSPLLLDMEVPCRQCENCLRRRAHHWRLRALTEWREASRTWFGSLTLNPDAHSRVLMACRHADNQNGDCFDARSAEEQFALRHKMISKEITLYVKRVRKESGAELRFLCVVEAHKNGLPHYHMLVHEQGATECKHRILSDQWRCGFTNWKLVTDPRAAGYVTKYLSKSTMARVRASIDYGKRPHDIGPTSGSVIPMTHAGDGALALVALAASPRNSTGVEECTRTTA